MSRRYAEGTQVDETRSEAEIKSTLRRFGADSVMTGYDGNRAFVLFRSHDRFVRFVLELPAENDPQFTTTPNTKRRRSDGARQEAYEQERRRRWRSLANLVKAKLAAVQDGITEFEDEFLAQTVMPDNQTVAEHVRGRVAIAYETGDVPKMLPDYSERRTDV